MSQIYKQSIKETDDSNIDSTLQSNNRNILLNRHPSIMDLLTNTELDLEISRFNSRNVCDSPDLDNNIQSQQLNEFSSWHMVQQNSNSSSYNNLSGPSSILSSDDAEENLINNYLEHSRQLQHPLQRRTDIFFDKHDDDEEELDENTIHQVEKLQMPSFIMPKMSMIDDEDQDKLKVNIIGEGSHHLIDRLNLYNKILQNVKFNNMNPDLIVLVVDQNNLLLSQQLSKPFIPVFISNEESSVYEQDLQSTMITSMSKLCQPIRLKSLNDDLFLLINLLSNIDIKLFHDKKLSNTSIIKKSSNSKRIKKSKKNRRIPKKLVNLICKIINNTNTSKILLSVGYLGICYYGVSFLLSKKKTSSSSDLIMTTTLELEPKRVICKSVIKPKDIQLSADIVTTQLQMLYKNFEKLLDNLIERGKLTSYWIYYNVLIMWE